MKSDIITKIKQSKDYVSLNLLSFIGYLTFVNSIFTIYFVKPILTDKSGLDEMFYGVSYGLYEITLLVINIILLVIFYVLYKFERKNLKKHKKKSYINYSTSTQISLFYIGYILFLCTFFIYYKAIYLIIIFFVDCIFDLTGISNLLQILG